MALLKKSFLKKRFRKLLLESENNRVVNNQEINTVGIISSDEITNWIDIKEEVETILGIKDVEIYSFRPYKKKDKASLCHFSEKDITWKGEIKKPHFKAFLEKPFDLLIGYFNKENLYNQYAILKSNATFKAGISKVNQDLYDLEIAEYPTNSSTFLLELKKYLQILKKLKN